MSAQLDQPRGMAPWEQQEAGRWVATSPNPLRPWFELSSPCAKIRCDRCSGIARLTSRGELNIEGCLGLEGGEVDYPDYHDARIHSYGF
jgi:hypothetical protein